MSVYLKQDVCGDLSIKMQKAHGKLARYYQEHGMDFFVTSRRDGIHGLGSLHYNGNAEDFDGQGVFISELKELMGKDFDLLDERHHIHCEYDPK